MLLLWMLNLLLGHIFPGMGHDLVQFKFFLHCILTLQLYLRSVWFALCLFFLLLKLLGIFPCMAHDALQCFLLVDRVLWLQLGFGMFIFAMFLCLFFFICSTSSLACCVILSSTDSSSRVFYDLTSRTVTLIGLAPFWLFLFINLPNFSYSSSFIQDFLFLELSFFL